MVRITKSRVLGLIAISFGVLTVLSGGTALFGGPEASVAVGNVVPFVLWFNFMAGFAYLAAGVAILAEHRTAKPLSVTIALATMAVFTAFLMHVAFGGAYELRTLLAMLVRISVWLGIAAGLRNSRPVISG
jgi:hypothetical protein